MLLLVIMDYKQLSHVGLLRNKLNLCVLPLRENCLKLGKFYLRIFPDKPVTKKPAETRMGKGKGNPELWVSVVKRGRVICEVAGMTEAEARDSTYIQLPINCQLRQDL